MKKSFELIRLENIFFSLCENPPQWPDEDVKRAIIVAAMDNLFDYYRKIAKKSLKNLKNQKANFTLIK